MATVPFKRKTVKEYLDNCIRFWREKIVDADERGDRDAEVMATYYVDCFQSVRVSIFGELFPPPEEKNPDYDPDLDDYDE